jgi:hypothetical protein
MSLSRFQARAIGTTHELDYLHAHITSSTVSRVPGCDFWQKSKMCRHAEIEPFPTSPRGFLLVTFEENHPHFRRDLSELRMLKKFMPNRCQKYKKRIFSVIINLSISREWSDIKFWHIC